MVLGCFEELWEVVVGVVECFWVWIGMELVLLIVVLLLLFCLGFCVYVVYG